MPSEVNATCTRATRSSAARKAYSKLWSMLFMVIERFRYGDVELVGERFRSQGRMLPEGVVHHTSWLETSGLRCFQLMEAASPEALTPWVSRWEDLVDFEIVPVLPSGEFWARTLPGRA
jgi:Domain of unknown function (DUF3303)